MIFMELLLFSVSLKSYLETCTKISVDNENYAFFYEGKFLFNFFKGKY